MAISDKSQTFPKNPAVSLELLARGVEQYLIQREGMICQILKTPMGISIQTKKKEDWKKYVMLDNAMQVDLTETEQCVTAQIGGAKWIAKGAAIGVGMIIAWPIGIPLMALSSIGGFGSMNLPKKILGFIEQFLMTGGQNIAIPPEDAAQQYQVPAQARPHAEAMACPACGEAIPVGTKHCPECGASTAPTCPECGVRLDKERKFCPECGASTAPKKNFCQACGAEVDGTPKFCPECGEKF